MRRHPRLCTLLLSPLHAIWEGFAAAKASALCKCPSLLLERRVPARPSPAGASQVNQRLGFSKQPNSLCGSISDCASGQAGVSPLQAAWDYSQAQGPHGEGKSSSQSRDSHWRAARVAARLKLGMDLCMAGARDSWSLQRGSKGCMGTACSSPLRTQALVPFPQLSNAQQRGEMHPEVKPTKKQGMRSPCPPGAGQMGMNRGAAHIRGCIRAWAVLRVGMMLRAGWPGPFCLLPCSSAVPACLPHLSFNSAVFHAPMKRLSLGQGR